MPLKRYVSSLIPTEATPESTPPPPSVQRAHAVTVNNGFLAIPVLLPPIAGLKGGKQWIYLREKEEESTSSHQTGTTVFAVNIPFGSSEENVRKAFLGILQARQKAAKALQDSKKGKGKAKERIMRSIDESCITGVEFVQSAPRRKTETLLDHEGIRRPSELFRVSEGALAKMSSKSSKSSTKDQEGLNGTMPKADVHPLFLSESFSTTEASQHLRPSSSTVKAHITFSSSSYASMLLGSGPEWIMSQWPASIYSESADKSGKKRTRDEILYDMARVSLEQAKLHTDEWMKRFDSLQPKPAAPPNVNDVEIKSKRAQAREAALRAKKKAELEKAKAIKKRRLYDDDFLSAETDPDGWTTVTRGGKYGRSAGEGVDADSIDIEDEEEMRQAELEGFVSGKRSVGVASKDFIKQEEARIKAERQKELDALNAKLGIDGGASQGDQRTDGHDLGLNNEDDSRGSGRGKKKKKSRGIELGMYGHQKREVNKKQTHLLRQRFEDDKRKIAELKRQKRFRPY